MLDIANDRRKCKKKFTYFKHQVKLLRQEWADMNAEQIQAMIEARMAKLD
jgi:hypothetical protein